MRFRVGRKASSSNKKAAAADGNRPASSVAAVAAAADAKDADGGGALIVASPDLNGTENGSKDESFFEARPWLDSDSEDDFHSVRGDFTPSRGSTPDHQRQTSFTERISVDRLKPSLIEKKQRLLELLQEKQQYDDEHDSVTDVHAEEHLKSSGKGEKAKKSSRAGCFPSSVWKFSFKSCRKKKKE